MTTSKVWSLESFFLEIYSLLVHRINGLGLSLEDFYKWDTWTTSKLYCMEIELIDEEKKQLKDKPSPEDNNDEEVEDLFEEMFSE